MNKNVEQYADYGFDEAAATHYRALLKVEVARFLALFFEEDRSERKSRTAYNNALSHFLAEEGREARYCRRSFWTDATKDFLEEIENYLSTNAVAALREAGYTLVLVSSQFKLIIDGEGKIVAGVSFGQMASEKFCITFGSAEVEDLISTTLGERFPLPLPSTVNRLESQLHGAIASQMKVVKDKRPITDTAAFWPFLDNADPAAVAQAFQESEANVLVLYGAPGLGKSQFIREMIKWKDRQKGKTFIADTKDVFASPRLVPFIHDLPDLSWFITEDGMEMLERRENGNNLMTGLLNAVEGISSGNVKFIISTNLLSLNSVDSAIIRPGRLFDALHFEKLSPVEANRARNAIGLPAVDFTGQHLDNNKLTLAEALNWETTQRVRKLTKTNFL